MQIDPKETPVPKMHSYLLGAVAPRPIAFASTVDKESKVNLSPFSFFNVFSANPPILIFSPARRGRDNTVKNTYENVLEVPEVVINVVSYSIVQQTSLASAEYPKGVNEFIKAGLTQIPSVKVKPPRVGESKISMECKVNNVISLGDGGAAGNLVICEVLLMHIDDSVLDAEGKIDPFKLDAVARMGGDWYCRANGDSLFRLPQPGLKLGIGIEQLPEAVRNSPVFSGSDLALLAGVEQLPSVVQPGKWASDTAIHQKAKEVLVRGDVAGAWRILAG
ncbi:MAG: flavin reductase family protein [Flammeovirgaceae bacterium]|nr:MAG: flavin reductase family protein [Flammeovirgaceae bacterium]